MSFHFRFESLHFVAINHRDQLQRHIATQIARIASIQEQSLQIATETDRLRHEQRAQRTGRVTIVSLSAGDRRNEYLATLRRDLQAERRHCEAALSEFRSQLLQAQHEVQRLERLREGDLKKHRKKQEEIAQRQRDDLAAARHFASLRG